MKFSVIMASYLGPYNGAARNREQKIVRAVESVLKQTHEDWELLIVADGCDRTTEIIRDIWQEHGYDSRLLGFQIPKQRTWAGLTRNAGLDRASGDMSVYLDIDDTFRATHLEHLNRLIPEAATWAFFDDLVWDRIHNDFMPRKCTLRNGHCGTSNIAHRVDAVRWPKNGNYAHDWHVIQALQKVGNPAMLGQGGYCVCHIPGKLDI